MGSKIYLVQQCLLWWQKVRDGVQVSGASLELFLNTLWPKGWDLGRREAPGAGGAAASGMLLVFVCSCVPAAIMPVLTELKGSHSSS